MTHHLTLPCIPTEGEQELQRRFQKLLQSADSEPDLVSGRVVEVWRWLVTERREEPLLKEVRVTLGRCVQVAELIDQASRPTFKPLEEHTGQLEQLVKRVRVADFELQPLAEPLQRLAAVYQQALGHIKAHPAPLAVKAKLFIPGMGHYLISQEVARKLASKTLSGQNIKETSSGSNFVAHSQGVFYKRNPIGENAFSPALEAAVVSFHELLGGGSAAPTGCLKLRDVVTEGGGKQEYVLQAGMGMYGVPLDLLLSLQQWVEVFESAYGNAAGMAALFDIGLIEKIKKDYGALFKGDEIDVQALFRLFFAQVSSFPKEQRLSGFETLDISNPREQQDFEGAVHEAGALAGVWAFAVICRYPKVMPGLVLGHILNWYKGKEWLNRFMPEDSAEAKIRFAKEWQNFLDQDNSSLAILSTLLTTPKDGRADNYIVALPCDVHLKPMPFPKGKVPTLQLVSIDNDISLQAPYKASQNVYAKLLSVLLLLKRVMNQPLSEKVRKKILAKSPEDWILEWLKFLVNKEREFVAWQEEKLLDPSDIENCGVCNNPHPCGIDPKAVELMYTLLKGLCGVLHVSPKATLNDLFGAIYPELFAHYQSIEKQGLDPMRSYHLVEKTPIEAADRKQLIIFNNQQRPLVESVASLAKAFPWQGKQALSWLDLMGRMGLQEACFSKEEAQRLLPLAIKSGLSGAVRVLCAHEIQPIVDPNTQQTVFHLFAHTYIDDKLTDKDVLIVWKSLLSIKGSQVNARDARDKPAAFILLDGMVQKAERGALLLHEGVQHGLDLKITYNDETLFMRALRIAETEVAFRGIVQKLIPIGAAKHTPIASLQGYLKKVSDPLCQKLLLEHEPSLAWHFTLDAIAPLTAAETVRLTTPTETRYLTPAFIQKCPQDFQKMLFPKGTLNATDSPQEAYGRHLVFPYVEGTHAVHVKVFPEAPGYETAVKELFSLFFGEELPEHTLWRIEVPRAKAPIPVLCSQTVPGDNLHTVYRKDPLEAHQRLSQLREDHVSALICGTFLSLPEDGKPDNFILNGRRLVSIDNDHAFIRAIAYEDKEGIPVPILNLKSMVFCLDQMSKPLSSKMVAKIQQWPITDLLRLWLEKLDAHHQAFEKQFAKDKSARKEWVTRKNQQTVIGILFEGRTFPELYDRIQKLHKLVSRNPQITGFELLQRMLPTVAPFYQKVFTQFANPVDRFYQGIAQGRYGQATDGKVMTLTTSASLLSSQGLLQKSWYDPDPTQTPAHARLQMKAIQQEHKQLFVVQTQVQKGQVEALLTLVSPGNREKVVNSLDFKQLGQKEQKKLFKFLSDPKTGISFNKLRIKGSAFLTDIDLLSLLKLSPGLKELTLSDCPLLTNTSLGQLGRLTPNLQKLYLHQLPNLKEISYLPPKKSSGATQIVPLLHCTHITLKEAPQLVTLRLRTPLLQALSIEACLQLDPVPLVANLHYTPHITSLALPPLPTKYMQPLLFALGRQKRHQVLIHLLEKVYPTPQETLSLPGINLTDNLEAWIPFLKKVSPKTLHLPATSLTPQGLTALLKASFHPTLVTFDPAAPIKPMELHTLPRHTLAVETCCQLADGRIVSGSMDNTLKVWDPVSFQCLATLPGHTNWVNTCCQLADGRLVSGAGDGTLKVWDPVSFHCFAALQGHTHWVVTCCQLADGRILSGSYDNTLKVWDPVSFQCLATLQGHTNSVVTCCQLADGRIISGSEDKTLKIWDPVSFQCLATLQGHTDLTRTCYQLADGRIVSGSHDKTLKVWDPVSFHCLATLQGHTESVETCCQLADGRILSGSGDNTLKVWDPVSFQCLATLQGHKDAVSTCCQLVDGRIVSGSYDNTLKVWDVEATSSLSLEALKKLQHAACWVEGEGWLALFWKVGSGAEEALWQSLVVRFRLKELYQERFPEGKLSIFGSSASKQLRAFWEALQASEGLSLTTLKVVPATLKCAKPLIAASTKLEHLELPWKEVVALPRPLSSSLKTLTSPIVTSAEITRLATLQGHTGLVKTCCPLADGRIVSGSFDNTLKVWDPATFQCLATLQGHTSAVQTCCSLADGRIVSGSWDNTLKVWDPITFQCLATLQGHAYSVNTCCQLADGKIVSGSVDKTLKVWDPVSFHCLATLQGHAYSVWTCCQLADGRILSSSDDKTLKVWDPVSFHCLATLQGHKDSVRTCHPLADGRILSGSYDKTLKVWDPVTFQCLATLQEHTNCVLTCCQLADGRILSGSEDKTLKMWDPVTFECFATLQGHTDSFRTCCQLADGRIVSGSADTTLKVWNVPHANVNLRIDQLTELAPQVRWQKGRLIGPRGLDMHLWAEQLQRILEACFPKVRLQAEGSNVFSLRGRDSWEDKLVEKLVLLFVQN